MYGEPSAMSGCVDLASKEVGMRNRLLLSTMVALAILSLAPFWAAAQHVADPTCFSHVCEAVYDTLLDVDPNGNIVPRLVSAWEFSSDGQEIVLYLRQDVFFHNGEHLTSHVVRGNFEVSTNLFLDFRREPLLSSGLIEEVRVVNDYTLVIRPGLLCAFQVLGRLAGPAGMMVAPEALERYQHEPAHEPIGTGPYTLVAVAPEEGAALEAFHKHWNGSIRPASVELVVFPDEDDRVDVLKEGLVHAIAGSSEGHFKDLACATAFDVYGRPAQYQAVSDKILVWPFYDDGLMHFEGVVFDDVLVVAIGGFLECRPEEPRIVLTDAAGRETTRFVLLDTVYAAFTRLLPDTDYEVRLVQGDDQHMYSLAGKSDLHGVIPSTALLWDIGVEYHGDRSGRFWPEIAEDYIYTCEVLRHGQLLASADFSIVPLAESPPIVYASDEEGNPLNGFSQWEDVYVTGINFPRGSIVEVYLVRARYSWSVADRLDPLLVAPITIRVPFEARDFTELLWSGEYKQPGIYDVVAEWVARDGYFSRMDAIDGEYGVGFTIIGSSESTAGGGGSANHVETEVACQPPANNPTYKNYFGLGESVWVAVNPYSGGGNYSDKTARIYVVLDQTTWTDGTSLADKSGGYETVAIQPGCANANFHRVWPQASIGDYDVIVDFSPYGVYDKGQDIIDHVTVQGFVVPDPAISLQKIEFNHDPNSITNDGVNIRKDKTSTGAISGPEWQSGSSPRAVAYTAGNTVQIRVTFNAANWVQSAQIKAVTTSGGLSSIGYQSVTFNNGTATVTMNVTTPGAVDKFTQKWKWTFRNVDGVSTPEQHLATSTNKVYIILAQPTLPWTTTGTTQVWTNVLDWSCEWAKGQTSLPGAAAAVAQHLWDSSVTGGYYKYGSQYTDKKTGDMFLTNFLNNMPVIGYVNCYDMSKSSVSFGSVLGCDLNHFYTEGWGYMNCVKAIGKDWNCGEEFGNHAFSKMNNKVYDACMAVDTDSNPTTAPPATFTWLTDITWSDYKSDVMKGSTPGTPTQYAFTVQ